MTDRDLGTWALARSIVDADYSTTIICEGRATLRRDRDCFRYDEDVALHIKGKLMRATQTYIYRIVGDTLSATFVDGRAFFQTTLRTDGTATAIHFCGADIYRGTLTFRDDNWETQWVVSGTKALAITTRYERLANANPNIRKFLDRT